MPLQTMDENGKRTEDYFNMIETTSHGFLDNLAMCLLRYEEDSANSTFKGLRSIIRKDFKRSLRVYRLRTGRWPPMDMMLKLFYTARDDALTGQKGIPVERVRSDVPSNS